MSDNYHIAAQADVDSKVNRHIWFYFVMMGILLFITIYGLTVMYRFQLDYEKNKKIGRVNTNEVLQYRAQNQSYLSGKHGLFSDKKHVSIDEAIASFITDVRHGR